MLDPQADIFRPPEISTLVHCIHCNQEYDSYLIEWREMTCSDGKTRGFWCCPIPGCDGAGFGFDIFPVDPTFLDDRGGWVDDDESVDDLILPDDDEPPPEDRTPIEKPTDEDEDIPF